MLTFSVRYAPISKPISAEALAERTLLPTIVLAVSLDAALAAIAALNLQYMKVCGIDQSSAIVLTVND